MIKNIHLTITGLFFAVVLVACSGKSGTADATTAIEIVKQSKVANSSTLEATLTKYVVGPILQGEGTKLLEMEGVSPMFKSRQLEGDIYVVAFDFMRNKRADTETDADSLLEIMGARWKWRVNIKTKGVSADSQMAEQLQNLSEK
jgi:hypothetical protein